MKKIAVIDLLFRNPPKGGAGVDTFETFKRLNHSRDIRLFYPVWNGPFPRGCNVNRTSLPFIAIPVQVDCLKRENIVAAIFSAVDDWQPDIVFIADGWTLKPFIIKACSERYPTITRLYAYEMLCPRNNEKWLYDKPCDNSLLTDSEKCTKCVADYSRIVREKRGPDANPLIHEAELARIWDDDYPDAVKEALLAGRIITYNSTTAKHIKEMLDVTPTVIPGGVDPSEFRYQAQQPQEIPTIIVPGRMDDPAKGAEIAVAAGKLLHQRRIKFKMFITRKKQVNLPWLSETGWLSRESLIPLLRNSSIVLVPSSWPEAFGMCWVEAMAMKKPVIATQAPGPKEYIKHEKTGLLVPQADPAKTADAIERLLRDTKLTDTIASSGYNMVKNHLTWDKIATLIDDTFNIHPPTSCLPRRMTWGSSR